MKTKILVTAFLAITANAFAGNLILDGPNYWTITGKIIFADDFIQADAESSAIYKTEFSVKSGDEFVFRADIKLESEKLIGYGAGIKIKQNGKVISRLTGSYDCDWQNWCSYEDQIIIQDSGKIQIIIYRTGTPGKLAYFNNIQLVKTKKYYPIIDISSDKIHQNQELIIMGTGFPVSQKLEIFLNSSRILDSETNSQGSFKSKLILDAKPDYYYLKAVSSGWEAKKQIQILPPEQPRIIGASLSPSSAQPGSTVFIKITGEPNCNASFSIDNIAQNIALIEQYLPGYYIGKYKIPEIFGEFGEFLVTVNLGNNIREAGYLVIEQQEQKIIGPKIISFDFYPKKIIANQKVEFVLVGESGHQAQATFGEFKIILHEDGASGIYKNNFAPKSEIFLEAPVIAKLGATEIKTGEIIINTILPKIKFSVDASNIEFYSGEQVELIGKGDADCKIDNFTEIVSGLYRASIIAPNKLGLHQIKITYKNPAGNTNNAIVGFYVVKPESVIQITHEFQKGINLFYMPVKTDWLLSDLANHIGVNAIIWFNAENQKFISYKPNMPENALANKKITETDCFIVIIQEKAEIIFKGEPWF